MTDGTFIFPLSFAQERLWFLNQLEPESPAYNISIPVRLIGKLDLKALEQTLVHIIRRHETLRAVFVTVDEKPMQIIAPAEPKRLPAIDLSGLSEEKRETEA